MHGPTALADLIRKLQPDLIHSMEFQHCAYTALAAKEALGGAFPPWIASNWGSDIFLFGREPEHRKKIEQVLTGCDYYSAECHRDLELATQLGLKGKIVGTIPNCGGIDLRIASPLRRKKLPSARRLILVKGYEHFAGRALTALSVLETLKEELRDYEVVVFSASPATKERVAKLADDTLNIRVIDTVPHESMLSYFADARLYLGISRSDGISTSALEAMALGAFPIQTDTSCCGEWFSDGDGGFIVPHDRQDVIRDRVLKAVRDDALVDRAATMNWAVVESRLDKHVVQHQIHSFYNQVLEDIDARRDRRN